MMAHKNIYFVVSKLAIYTTCITFVQYLPYSYNYW